MDAAACIGCGAAWRCVQMPRRRSSWGRRLRTWGCCRRASRSGSACGGDGGAGQPGAVRKLHQHRRVRSGMTEGYQTGCDRPDESRFHTGELGKDRGRHFGQLTVSLQQPPRIEHVPGMIGRLRPLTEWDELNAREIADFAVDAIAYSPWNSRLGECHSTTASGGRGISNCKQAPDAEISSSNAMARRRFRASRQKTSTISAHIMRGSSLRSSMYTHIGGWMPVPLPEYVSYFFSFKGEQMGAA